MKKKTLVLGAALLLGVLGAVVAYVMSPGRSACASPTDYWVGLLMLFVGFNLRTLLDRALHSRRR